MLTVRYLELLILQWVGNTGRIVDRTKPGWPQVRNLSRLSSFPQVSRLSWPLVAAWGWTRCLARHSFIGTRRPRG
jgi:hypothetical protein